MPEAQAARLIEGGLYFQRNDGVDVTTYWQKPSFDTRDEFFLIANSNLTFIKLIKELDVGDIEDHLGLFQVAYLFQSKLNAQTIKSIDTLLCNQSYADSFALCRSLQSRVNLLLLFAFVPELFDHWIKNPNDQQYREGRVRKELADLGINTMSHIYRLASEVIHGHFLGHSNIGFFEKGLFSEIPLIRDQIYNASKFILAAATYALIQITLTGIKKGANQKDVISMDQLYEYFFKTILDPSNINHFWTILGESRHWIKTGDSSFNPGGIYSFSRIKELIQGFHGANAKGKRLSARYYRI